MDQKIAEILANIMPRCFLNLEQKIGAWGISWMFLEDIKEYFPKIASCPKSQKTIIKQCEQALNTGQFDIEEARFHFYQHGFRISVYPGNACYIFFDGFNFSNHNIDTPSQCYALQGFFVITLREIFEMIVLWQKDPNIGIEGEPKDRNYRIRRSLDSKPFQLWQEIALNFNDCIDHNYVWARDEKEAAKLLNSETYYVSPLRKNDGNIFSSYLKYKVEVSYQDSTICPPKIYNVLASNASHAESIIQDLIFRQPSFSSTKSIKAVGQGIIPSPMVFTQIDD